MKIGSLTEVISAAHLSFYVHSPFVERGGLMLVGPPASLKTAFTEVLDVYPNATLLSDLTVKQGVGLRDDIGADKITTIGFTDFAKLYQRQASGSSNVEGYIRALAGEGFRKANWEDQRMVTPPARAFIIGAMTQFFYSQHFGNWCNDGFARRFLFCNIKLANPHIIVDAIITQTRIDLSNGVGFDPRIPTDSKGIKYDCTENESRELSYLIRHQQAKEIGLVLLQKILSALKWKHKGKLSSRKAMAIIKDFSESLGKEQARLVL
jgi:hypothetical protein